MKKILYFILACFFMSISTNAQKHDIIFNKHKNDISTISTINNQLNYYSGDPLWVDIVTSQPNGYNVDENGNVQISTPEGLAWLISEVNGLNGCNPNNFKDLTVTLTSNINLNEIEERRFTPIGNRSNPFMGTFDGNNFIIDGLNIVFSAIDDDPALLDIGMFGYINNGTIKNIKINSGILLYTDSDTEEWYQGAIVGFSDSLSLVENCNVNMNCNILNGGTIVGVNRNSTIRNCAYSSKSIVLISLNGGGIAMHNICDSNYADAIIENCYFYGKILGSYSVKNIGGIVCFNKTIDNDNNKKAIIRNCHVKLLDDIWGFDDFATVVANNSSKSVVEYCYADLSKMIEHNAKLFSTNEGEATNCTNYTINDYGCTLAENISIGNNNSNLLIEVLNLWIPEQENPFIYKTWKISNNSIPEFDKMYNVIENDELSDEITIYPNPVSQTLKIEGTDILKVKIYDISGRLINTYYNNCNEINVNNYPDGAYLLNIITNKGKSHTTKFIVNK